MSELCTAPPSTRYTAASRPEPVGLPVRSPNKAGPPCGLAEYGLPAAMRRLSAAGTEPRAMIFIGNTTLRPITESRVLHLVRWAYGMALGLCRAGEDPRFIKSGL
jgi:hypothetical protein